MDITHCLKPWLTQANALGIFLFKLQNEKLKISYLGLFSLISYVLIYNGSFIIHFPRAGFHYLHHYVSIVHFTIYYLCSVFLISTFLMKGKQLFSVIEKISKIDAAFSDLNIKFNYNHSKRKLITYLFAGFIFVLIIFVTDKILYYILGSHLPTLMWFAQLWEVQNKFSILIMFFFIMSILKDKYAAINDQILKDFKNKKLTEKRVKQLKNLHGEISIAAERLNQILVAPIMSLLVALFVVITVDFYFCYGIWYNSGDNFELLILVALINCLLFIVTGLGLFPSFVRLSEEVCMY